MIIKIIIIICSISIFACNSKPITESKGHLLSTVDSLVDNGDFEKATPIIQSLLREVSNDNFKAELMFRYGLCLENLEESDSCIMYYSQAADIFKSESDSTHLTPVLLSLGITYLSKGNYSEAMRIFSDGLRMCRSRKDSVFIYIAVCVNYVNQNFYDSAHLIIQDYLLSYEKRMQKKQAYYIYLGEGLYYNSVNKFDSALIYLQQALPRSENNFYKANTYTNIASVYKSMRDFSMALKYLDSAGSLHQDEGWDENKQFDYDTYREVYDSLGNHDSAYHYAQLYRILSDKIYNAKNNDLMVNAVANAKTIAQRAETDRAIADSKLKKRSLIFTATALGLVFFLAILAFRNTRIKQKANLLLTQQKQQVQELADQLAVANDTKARLFSTIGHDLRSPVSSLYASLKMQELKGNATGGEMSEQTVRLLDTLEELLIWSKSQMDGFKVQPVKINVRYFFEDLKEFYTTAVEAKNISIVNDTAKEVVIRADENLLKTIFRNAISNAIANTIDGSTIRLTATSAIDGKICMSVSNPCSEESYQKFKTNFDDAAVKSGAYGLGIVLIKEFAQKLGGCIELAYTQGAASLRLCV